MKKKFVSEARLCTSKPVSVQITKLICKMREFRLKIIGILLMIFFLSVALQWEDASLAPLTLMKWQWKLKRREKVNKITFKSFSSLESEKAGNISSYFSMANWNMNTDTVTTRNTNREGSHWVGLYFTFAFSSSTMKWHSEALKKYSLALYFKRGLSMVLIATCRKKPTNTQEFKGNIWFDHLFILIYYTNYSLFLFISVF